VDADEKAGSLLFQLPPETIEAAALLADAIYHEPPVDPVDAAIADLAAASDVEAAEGPLRRLCDALRGADPLRRATVRESAIAALRGKVSAPAHLVKMAFDGERPPAGGQRSTVGQGRGAVFADPDPWPDLVNGSDLLHDLEVVFARYVALPPHAAATLALWTLHTHALDAADVSPILALTSPEKRCGKTRTLSLLARLVRRPLPTSNITPAAVFRAVESFSPTLLVDEADSFLREREELRGVLNSGHTRDTAFVVRAVGDEHEARPFSTWAPKAIALIGRLPDTLEDRSIMIPMRRRAPHEHVERLRSHPPAAVVFEELRRRAMRWAGDNAAELREADPAPPGDLNDRAEDNWTPLLAIADAVGGEWPDRARRAARALSGAVEAGDGTGEQLLADLRAIFSVRGAARMFSHDLVGDLNAKEDRPWKEWRRGNPLTQVQLAQRLRPFGIRPGTVRIGSETAKGYALEQFAEAFARYLPPTDPSQPSQPNGDSVLREFPTRHTASCVTARDEGVNPCEISNVTDVTAQDPGAGWKDVE
jgi:putative DNA primase/helicase